MPDNEDVVAIYSVHTQAESAVKTLHKAGYDISKLSIVVNDYHFEERVVGFYGAGDRMKHWGVYGVLWGGIFGLLLSGLLVMIPGAARALGLFNSPLTVAIGGVLGAAALTGGLGVVGARAYSMLAPKDSMLKYDLSIEKIDEFLLVVRGAAEAAAARRILDAALALAQTAYPSSAQGYGSAGEGGVWQKWLFQRMP